MTPIINPLWFYLIGISENIACTFWIIGILLIVAGIIIGVTLLSTGENIKEMLMPFKKAVIIGVLLITIGNLIPSKDTCYKMMTAALVTPNNISAVGEAATDVVDYIVDSVDQLLKKGETAE